MLNDEEGGLRWSSRDGSPVTAAPRNTRRAGGLIHDMAGKSLSKQFKDKIWSFLTPPNHHSAPSGADTTFFPPRLQSSSVVKEIL